jgi:hypothetical protein
MYPAAAEASRNQAVAIIPQMGWQELTDEALIARYRAEGGQAQAGQGQAEQYLNEIFRRHHVKVARWCLSVTGDRESAANLALFDYPQPLPQRSKVQSERPANGL